VVSGVVDLAVVVDAMVVVDSGVVDLSVVVDSMVVVSSDSVVVTELVAGRDVGTCPLPQYPRLHVSVGER